MGFDLFSLKGRLHVSLNDDGNRASLETTLEGNLPAATPYIETWQGNTLLHAAAYKAGQAPSAVEFDPNSLISVKIDGSFAGIGLRLIPVEFRTADWLSLSLFLAQSGDFSEASTVLAGRVASTHDAKRGVFERLSKNLENLVGLTRIQDSFLTPAPAFRSSGKTPVRQASAYRPVWEGLRSGFSELRDLDEPPRDITGLAETNLELRELVSALLAALNGESVSFPERAVSTDPRISEGWAALVGYQRFQQNRFKEASEAFRKSPPGPEDRYSLGIGILLSGRFLSTREDEARDEEIWKDLYAGVLSAC